MRFLLTSIVILAIKSFPRYIITVPFSMVKIFDKMQNQLFVEQEKYSAAMRQIKQLEKQVRIV